MNSIDERDLLWVEYIQTRDKIASTVKIVKLDALVPRLEEIKEKLAAHDE